jgi:hypothetical protein
MSEQWKLVPVEPTPEMLRDALGWREGDTRHGLSPEAAMCERIYYAMLRAAPPPPHPDAEGPNPHPGYGPCDWLGPNGSCAQCLELYGTLPSAEMIRAGAIAQCVKIATAPLDLRGDKYLMADEIVLLLNERAEEMRGASPALNEAEMVERGAISLAIFSTIGWDEMTPEAQQDLRDQARAVLRAIGGKGEG